MTRPGGRGLAALLLAAVLGVSGGVVAALLGPGEPQQKQARDPDRSEPPTGTPLEKPKDPLGLGVPLENVDCTGQTLIMVGWGDIRTALSPSVADWPGVKYLNTRKSCPTVYPPSGGRTPMYVAYLPPFDKPDEACKARMVAGHKGHFVGRMNSWSKVGVQCACEIEVTALPEIGEGQPITTESGMWIYHYQRMLADIGMSPANFPTPRFVTGHWDDRTTEATYSLQSDATLNPTGIVNADTWSILRSRACRLYDY